MCAMTMEREKEFTLQEVADMLGISYPTAIRRIQQKKIRARKEGQKWRVTESDLAAYIEQTYREGTERTP